MDATEILIWIDRIVFSILLIVTIIGVWVLTKRIF